MRRRLLWLKSEGTDSLGFLGRWDFFFGGVSLLGEVSRRTGMSEMCGELRAEAPQPLFIVSHKRDMA